METINFKGVRKDYDVIIENYLLAHSSKYFNSYSKILLVYDNSLRKQYINVINKIANITNKIGITANEKNKSFKSYNKIIDVLVDNNYNKDDLIISFGGGVISDIVGFVAGSYKRGINFISVPTTLLAMVDASIGSKNAINNKAKNIVGSFYDPSLVIVDPNLLPSLPKKELVNGLCEILKIGLIADKSLVNDLNKNILDIDIVNVIVKAIKLKEKFVRDDIYDLSTRHALNFGHSYGHAIELIYNIDHGLAVGYGMMYVASKEVKEVIIKIFNKWNINLDINFDESKLKELIKQDKKITNNKINMVICNKIGSYIIESREI